MDKTNKQLIDISILDHMSIAYVLVEKIPSKKKEKDDYVVLDINHSLTALVGIERNTIIGKKLNAIFSVLKLDDDTWYYAILEDALLHKRITKEGYFAPKNKWLKYEAYSPEANKIIVLITDIDEQTKLLEERTNILLALNGIIIQQDEELRYLKLLYSDETILFAKPETLIGKKMEDVFDATMAEIFNKAFKKAKEESKPVVVTYPSVLKNDHRHFETTIRYLPEQKMYISSVIETTKEKQLLKAAEDAKDEFESFFNINIDLMAIISSDGRFLKINREWEKTLGYDLSEMENKKYFDFVHPEDIESTSHVIKKIQNDKRVDSFVNRYKTKDGRYRYLEWRGQLFKGLIYSVARDITRQREMQLRLYHEKEVLETTLVSIGDGVISTDAHGRIVLINQVAEQLLDCKASYAVGKKLEDVFRIVHTKDQKDSHALLHFVFKNKVATEISADTLEIPHNNKFIIVEHTVSPIKGMDGSVQGAVIIFRDYADKKEKLEKIQHLSYHDQLTGVYNRRFYERQLLELNTKKNMPLTIAIFDVNGLKFINDAFGHEAGDVALQKVSRAIVGNVRSQDIVARIGGDEFVVLFPRTSYEVAKDVLEMIHRDIIVERVETIYISASYGWHTKITVDEPMAESFRIAEDNMYSLKLSESKSMRTKTVDVILKTLFEKNEREEQHCKRVSDFCVRIGTKLGLNSQDIGKLQVAGIMHDIGKIVVDEQILNKVEPLTNEEWEMIRKHPEVGYRILSSIAEFAPLAEFVLSHHERWDGAGYPRQILGEAIPQMARIISVVEAFDAMTVGAPYHEPLTFEEAIMELKKNKGTQFDPKMVDVFVEILENSDDVKDNDIIRYNQLKQDILALAQNKEPQFPKKDLNDTSIDDFLRDHGFNGIVMHHGKDKILYFGYNTYVPLRAMQKSETVLPWRVVQPYTTIKEPMFNVGLYSEGIISTSDPRGTGAIYHNVNTEDVVIDSKNVYGYQGVKWGYDRYGMLLVDKKGLIKKQLFGQTLLDGVQITLHPGDYLITLFEADRNALGGVDNSYAMSSDFEDNKRVKIIHTEKFAYRGR